VYKLTENRPVAVNQPTPDNRTCKNGCLVPSHDPDCETARHPAVPCTSRREGGGETSGHAAVHVMVLYCKSSEAEALKAAAAAETFAGVWVGGWRVAC
jgi:hypothetical protein